MRQKSRDGDPPQRGGRRSTAGVGDVGGADGSVGPRQSLPPLPLSSLLAGSTPEHSRLMDKISTLTTVVDKLQHILDDHIQRIKYEEDRTPVAVEEISKKAFEWIQLKTEELVEAMMTQTEKTILQRLDGSLQDWNKVLTEQLRAFTDDVQDLALQTSTSQSTTMQDVAADIRRTFEDCLQRFEVQVESRIVEKAVEKAITHAEKGQGMVMSMVAQMEKAVQQRLGETLQNWTETLTDQLRTAVDVIQDQSRRGSSGQSPTLQQDARISNEISDLKTAIAALNASTQVIILLFVVQFTWIPIPLCLPIRLLVITLMQILIYLKCDLAKPKAIPRAGSPHEELEPTGHQRGEGQQLRVVYIPEPPQFSFSDASSSRRPSAPLASRGDAPKRRAQCHNARHAFTHSPVFCRPIVQQPFDCHCYAASQPGL